MPSKAHWETIYSDKVKASLAFKIAVRVYHRTLLSEAQNHKCCYCGIKMTEQRDYKNSSTIDHVIPKSKGGPNCVDNYVIACELCNGQRGVTPADQYYIERSVKNRKQVLQNQMRNLGLHFNRHSKPSRLQRKLDKAEVQKVINLGLPNPYEIGTRQFKHYERLANLQKAA